MSSTSCTVSLHQEKLTDLISHIQYILEIHTHPMVLHGKEDSVEDDAEGDHQVKDGIIDNLKQYILRSRNFN